MVCAYSIIYAINCHDLQGVFQQCRGARSQVSGDVCEYCDSKCRA